MVGSESEFSREVVRRDVRVDNLCPKRGMVASFALPDQEEQ
jgi:hypothetical protein